MVGMQSSLSILFWRKETEQPVHSETVKEGRMIIPNSNDEDLHTLRVIKQMMKVKWGTAK